MEKYKVIALSVGGLNNKVYKTGDIVTEECFPKGTIKKLVEQNFLVETEVSKNAKIVEKNIKKDKK